MRKMEFAVPKEAMPEFAEEMATYELDNKVTGANHRGDIIIEIEYERHETPAIDDLEKFLEELVSKLETESGEEEQEEEDEK
jgi:hypothetical protein